jgi:N-acetylglucosamine kinase-like BadF-type ATPase
MEARLMKGTECHIGVDGGGTGSRALVTDQEGVELGMAQGPPALVHPSNPGAAAAAIAETIRAAVGAALITLPARALWAGLAGAGQPGAREAVEIALRSLALARDVRVGMDVEGAHMDAFGDNPGVLLVVGTGSQAWGRDRVGREIRVGGWGGVLADEGSGYWLGLQGLKAVLRASDGRGPATVLTSTLLKTIGFTDPVAIVPWVAQATKGEVAALAPLVLEGAAEGDEAAIGLVEEATRELRRYLEVVRERWGPHHEPIPMALVGGLVEEGEPLRTFLAPLIQDVGGALQTGPVVPVRGAACLARSLASA